MKLKEPRKQKLRGAELPTIVEACEADGITGRKKKSAAIAAFFF